MGANPHANGGILLRDLQMPDFHAHAVTCLRLVPLTAQDTLVLGQFLRDVAKLNQEHAQLPYLWSRRNAIQSLGCGF